MYALKLQNHVDSVVHSTPACDLSINDCGLVFERN